MYFIYTDIYVCVYVYMYYICDVYFIYVYVYIYTYVPVTYEYIHMYFTLICSTPCPPLPIKFLSKINSHVIH